MKKLSDDLHGHIERLYRHVTQEFEKTNEKIDKVSEDVEYLSSKYAEHDKELFRIKRKLG
mgnify:CR=1 FL=1